MHLDEDDILEKFDALVADGTAFYEESARVVRFEDGGLQFEFRVSDALAGKPATSPTQTQPKQPPASAEPSGCRPGSDIDVSGFEITPVSETHLLAINKFAAVRPHLLLLTQDGFQRQYTALDRDDLASARAVFASFQRPYLVFYNCRVEGGCSRLHKHMQVIPSPEGDEDGMLLWPDWDEARRGCIPFHYFLHRFKDGILPAPEDLSEIYEGLLGQAQKVLHRDDDVKDGSKAIPHNVAMNQRWIVVIPRRKGDANGVGVNGAGMLGLAWVSSEKKLKDWMEFGPANVLVEVGVANTHNGRR
ncbi:ATP adenylyltransferase-domain-containing protein [Podospora appendiculata]|uniref:ATP adenylyltransferase-domain-containing protein n=1 Tax=Podospora appendiculata TaxID=314037 RepID=A0AAE1C9L0_9PEZI|nr:ATP adenylyltransferase-domain-containing protein [Podospora appendiculata]